MLLCVPDWPMFNRNPVRSVGVAHTPRVERRGETRRPSISARFLTRDAQVPWLKEIPSGKSESKKKSKGESVDDDLDGSVQKEKKKKSKSKR